ADGGAGMDLDSRKEPSDLRNETRQQRDAGAIQAMGQAVKQDGVKSGITEYDLEHAFSGGIFPEYGIELLPDGTEHNLIYLFPFGCAKPGEFASDTTKG